MKTGKTVTKNEIEDHLDNDNWIEVFQDGSAEDMLFVQGIAATDRTYSKAIAVEGQPSPLLIRLSAYVRATQRTACPACGALAAVNAGGEGRNSASERTA